MLRAQTQVVGAQRTVKNVPRLHCSSFIVQWRLAGHCESGCWWFNENNGHEYSDWYAGGASDGGDDVGVSYPRPVGPSGAVEKMDRMKIIKRRLSMSLRSARPVDDSLSELAEQMALDEPSATTENGETWINALAQIYTQVYTRQQILPHIHTFETYFKRTSHTNVLRLVCEQHVCIIYQCTTCNYVLFITKESSKAGCVYIMM